jgi:hypothetical protein
MVFYRSKTKPYPTKKSIIAIAFLRNKSGTFPLNILQIGRDPLITALIVLNLNFPWTHVLNQPLELMVQHEQFQFQLIEELLKGDTRKITVPKAPAL